MIYADTVYTLCATYIIKFVVFVAVFTQVTGNTPLSRISYYRTA